MAKVIDVINRNIKPIKELIKIGRVPLSLMCDYDIYNSYKSIKDESRQMKKYERVAKTCKVSVTHVRKIVKEMDRVV